MNRIVIGDFITEIIDKTAENDQCPVLTSSQRGIVTQDEYFNKQIASKNNIGYKIIRKGQFTYRAMSDTGRFYINRLVDHEIGIVSPAYPVFEVTSNSFLLPEFLQLYFHTEHFQNAIALKSTGSTRVSLKLSRILELVIDVPSISEQKKIAATLDAVSDLIRLRKRQLEELDLLVKARFVEMFGGGLVSYKKSRLDSLCSFFNDGNWIESKDQSFEGYRLIQTGNIGNGEYLDKDSRARFISEETFSRLNCTEVFEGDILISRLPDPIGRACTIPSFVGKAITAVDCTIVRLKDICRPEYFIEFSKAGEYAEQLNSFTTGSTRKRVSRSNLGSIIVPVPPIDLQNHFASIYKKIDKLKQVVQKSQEWIEVTKKSLMQQHFGK